MKLSKLSPKNIYLCFIFIFNLVFGINPVISDTATINVSGKILPSICEVSPFPVVQLGNIRDIDMSQIGDTSQPTFFSLTISGCPKTVSTVSADFIGPPDLSDSSLYQVTPGDGSADGLAIRGDAANLLI